MSNISRRDIIEYANVHGKDSGYCLLLLIGCDGFDGDYDEYKELEQWLNDNEGK